jgi:talin
MATVKAVAAGNSGRQEDIIAAANMGRKAVSDLLRGCRVTCLSKTISFIKVAYSFT